MKTLFSSLALSLLLPLCSFAGTTQLTTQNYQNTLSGNRFVVVDVYTDWCGPCKALTPVFQSLSDELGSQYSFVKLNGESEPEIQRNLKITGYPTIIFMKDGSEAGRHVGGASKDQLRQLMNKYFK